MRFAGRIVKWLVVILVLGLAAIRLAAHLREDQPRDAVLPVEGRMVATPMGAIYVEEAGPTDGPPVLLAHGSVAWSRFWRETATRLADEGYRTIAFDLPPMGYSDRPVDGDYSRATQAARILALVDALDARPALVAHSYGAGPGAEAVLRSPGTFAGFVVVDGAISLGAEPGTLPLPLRPEWVRGVAASASVTNPWAMKPLLAAFLHRKDRALPEYVEILRAPGRIEGSTRAYAAWLPELLVPPTGARSTDPAEWAAMRLPLALVWGVEDSVTPLAQGEAIAALVPGARFWPIPDVGHIPQIEDPEAFQSALLAALEFVLR